MLLLFMKKKKPLKNTTSYSASSYLTLLLPEAPPNTDLRLLGLYMWILWSSGDKGLMQRHIAPMIPPPLGAPWPYVLYVIKHAHI